MHSRAQLESGSKLGIVQPCTRGDLICVLPLGVVFNRAGKRQLIWDGRHVNAHLREEDSRMETLSAAGSRIVRRRQLWGHCGYFCSLPFCAYEAGCHPPPRLRVGRSVLPLPGAAFRTGDRPAG